MKTIALIVLALVLFAACENLESSIKQEDDSFRTTKTSLKNYNTKSYNTNVYVDTSENYLLRNDITKRQMKMVRITKHVLPTSKVEGLIVTLKNLKWK